MYLQLVYMGKWQTLCLKKKAYLKPQKHPWPTQQIPMTCCDVHLRNESRHAKVAKFHAAPIHWRGKPDRKTWRQTLHGAKPTVKRGTTWICFAKLRNFQANLKKNTNNLNISEIYWIFLNHCIALYGSLKIDLHGKCSSTCMSHHKFRWNQIWEDMDLRETKHREP